MWTRELNQSRHDKKGRSITFCAFYIQNAGFRIDIEQIQAANKSILAGMMNASIRKHGEKQHHSARLPSSEG